MLQVVVAAREAGATVIVACMPGGDVEREFGALGIPVEPIAFTTVGLASAVLRVRALAQETGAEIIHSNGWLTNIVARLAARGSRPMVVNSVLVDPDAPRLSGASRGEQVARNALDKRTIRRPDALAPITNAVAAKLEALGAPPERITVIPGSVDADGIRAAAESESPGFERGPDCRYVGTVGRLEAVKGAEVFVRAAAVVAQSHRDVRFVIGGAGSLDGDLRAASVALRLSTRLDFLGKVPSAAATFAALDIVVVPSLSEGFGIVAAEAMALGKPVIASRVGGLPEVVEDGVTGILVDPDDPAALASAITVLLSDPDRARAMGEAGRVRVQENFTLERMTAGYLALYASLLAHTESEA